MKRKHYVIIGFIALIAVIAIFLLLKYNLIERIDVAAIKDYIDSYGMFAAPIFVVIFVLRTLLIVFPFTAMVVLGGSLFGVEKGFIINMISVFLSASFAFFISRKGGKDFVEKISRGKLEKFHMKIQQHGFKIILLMRLSSVFPFDLPNYAAGLTNVKYKEFILATVFGIIPEVFSLTYLGYNLKNPFSEKFIAAIVLVVLTITIPIIYWKVKKKKALINK